jgi:hypothetical protein
LGTRGRLPMARFTTCQPLIWKISVIDSPREGTARKVLPIPVRLSAALLSPLRGPTPGDEVGRE